MAPKRKRAVLREAAREAEKLLAAREKLAALEEGGSAARPIAVASASLVEPRALATRCLACEGALELVDHRAVHHGSALVREVVARCRACGRARTQWLRVAPPQLH
jgi:uncharacterized protein with PIN domain